MPFNVFTTAENKTTATIEIIRVAKITIQIFLFSLAPLILETAIVVSATVGKIVNIRT